MSLLSVTDNIYHKNPFLSLVGSESPSKQNSKIVDATILNFSLSPSVFPLQIFENKGIFSPKMFAGVFNPCSTEKAFKQKQKLSEKGIRNK